MKKLVLIIFLSLCASAGVISYEAQASDVAREVVVQDTSGPGLRVTGSSLDLMCGDSVNVKFEIFSITGQLVKAVTVASGTARVELPKGFYIVKCENWTRRVMLK